MVTDHPQLSEQPLLQTKVSIPQIPHEFVQRPRLTARITRGVKGPLTLLAVMSSTWGHHVDQRSGGGTWWKR